MEQACQKVCLIPSHPSSGSLSMIRYWKLACQFLPPACEGRFELQSLLPEAQAVFQKPAGKSKKALIKYLTYPLRTRLQAKAQIAHILDHSAAHLLNFLPKGMKTVVTVHDLFPLYFAPELNAKQEARFRSVVENLHKADLLISVSEFTKRDIIKHLGIEENKIQVALEGVDSSFWREQVSSNCRLPASLDEGVPLVICFGNCSKRKNLKLLPETFRLLKQSFGRVQLVRAGRSLDEGLRVELEKVLGNDFHELGFVSDDLLRLLYRSADVLFIPSLYEGFGLPVLEAMAAQCPVACSHSSSLPEVGLDAVVYFNPNSPTEAAEALQTILQDKELAQELVVRGKNRVKQLTWQRHFEQVADLYSLL